MKKLLLLFLFACSVGVYSQCFTQFSSGFVDDNSGTAGTGAVTFSLPSDNVVWATATTGTTATITVPTNRQVTVSSDGGLTFTRKNCVLYANAAQNTAQAMNNVSAISSTQAWISTHGSATAPGGVWRTDDAGTTWTRQTSAPFNDASSFVNFVHFWDANNGVVMGDPAGGYFEIYTTNNGGTNWTRVPSANIPTPLQNAPGGINDEIEYGLVNQFAVSGDVLWFGTTYGRTLKTTNKGLNWTAITTPVVAFSGGTGTNGPAGYSANQDWKSELEGTITDSDRGYWRTIDGGVNWVASSNPVPVQNSFKYVPGTAATVIAAGTKVDENGDEIPGVAIVYSFDDGLTWTDCTFAPGGSYYTGALEVRSANIAYMGGQTTSTTVGGIWRLNSPLLSSEEFLTSSGFKISPNPTSDKFNLTGENINQVQITDILGKVIISNNYAALSNVELSIADFNAGVYVVKVTNNEGKSSVVKVVKQ